MCCGLYSSHPDLELLGSPVVPIASRSAGSRQGYPNEVWLLRLQHLCPPILLSENLVNITGARHNKATSVQCSLSQVLVITEHPRCWRSLLTTAIPAVPDREASLGGSALRLLALVGRVVAARAAGRPAARARPRVLR